MTIETQLFADLTRRIEKIETALRELGTTFGGAKTSRCTFCQGQVENRHTAVLEHVKSCPRHPMRAVEAKLAEMQHAHDMREANYRALIETGPTPGPPPGTVLGDSPEWPKIVEVEAGKETDLATEPRYLQFKIKNITSDPKTMGGFIGFTFGALVEPPETQTGTFRAPLLYPTPPRPGVDQPDPLGAVPAPVRDPFAETTPELRAAVAAVKEEIRTSAPELDEGDRRLLTAILEGEPLPSIEGAVLGHQAEQSFVPQFVDKPARACPWCDATVPHTRENEGDCPGIPF